MATPSTLTSDIQRSIQQAVNHAHVALNNPDGPVTIKKKKRKRGGGGSEDRSPSADVEAAGRKKSKKKKPFRQGDSAFNSQHMSNGGPSATSEPLYFSENPTKRAGGKDQYTDIPIDPALTSNSEGPPDPQTVAFLQALVAAAGPTNPQLISTQVQMTPGFSYPMQPGFVDPACLVNGTQARLSLPELASHANEEIMRTLQGVDLAKLQGVLQVLGDAAAAAEQPSGMLHVPPGFQGMPPPPTLPPTKRNPTSSHTILGQPSKNNEPPPPPDWQQFANPAHAELLATKWMNTSKLKEMVQTEGPSCIHFVCKLELKELKGLVYRQGKFSDIEESQLRSAIENYRIVSS